MGDSMRTRFIATVGDLMEEDERTVVVLAVISRGLMVEAGLVDRFPHRIIDVGIREQTQIGVAGGLAMEGFTAIVTGYAPFLVERTFEQIKLSIAHQGVTAIFASVGGSWDAADSGRTHQAPEDIALMATLPAWDLHVPGHPDELEMLLRTAHRSPRSTYLRMSADSNSRAYATAPGHVISLRRGSQDATTLLVVGPLVDEALAATEDLDVTVLYTATPSPIDQRGLRAAVLGTDVVLVEPYLAGTSAGRVTEALADTPIRLRSHGVTDVEPLGYGTPADHRRFHGLDAAGIRRFVRKDHAVSA